MSALTNCPGFLQLALTARCCYRLGAGGLSLVALLGILSVLDAFTFSLASGEKTAPSKEAGVLARLGDQVSIRVAARGSPTINLSHGRDLLTAYEGPPLLQQALQQNHTQPHSLAAADFDEDGVPDLVSGYAYNRRGIISIHRGNVDSIYPNAPEAKQRKANGTYTVAPFISPARVFDAPVPADFIGAGDFDADGHWDVVVASRTANTLYLLCGDGHGNFTLSKQVDLPGIVTAMTTGEINRADGLTDVVVGVDGPDGSKALVFEGPNGALRSTPESFDLPADATSLALGQLDDSYETDLAVAAGNQLLIVYGRDRKLSLDPEKQQKVSPVQIEERAFASEIESLVIGGFADNHQPAVALLTQDGEVKVINPSQSAPGNGSSAPLSVWKQRSLNSGSTGTANLLARSKISSVPGDDLVVLDQFGMQILSNATKGDVTRTTLEASSPPVAVLPMRLNSDVLTDLVFLQKGQSAVAVVQTASAMTFVVNSTADIDRGQCTTAPNGCTLREAIKAANQNPGPDTIAFNIPTADAGFDGMVFNIKPLSGLPALTGGATTIDAATQTAFTGDTNPSGPEVVLDGSQAGSVVGLVIGSGSNAIKSIVVHKFDNAGIAIDGVGATGNVVAGCFVGTNASGTSAFGNVFDGIAVRNGATNNVIGGTTAAARNVISGNSRLGVGIIASSSNNNSVQGNFIGTDATGTKALANGQDGIQIGDSANGNLVGGTTPGARNVISANLREGVILVPPTSSDVSGNLIQGNYIGTDVTGTLPLGNDGVLDFEPANGISLSGLGSNTVGGTVVSARNVISGNGAAGINFGSASNQLVQGNYIGTDPTGKVAVANGFHGINMNSVSANNVIGGVAAGAGNLVSGNARGGVIVSGQGSDGNVVQGNFVGTDNTGTAALPNSNVGVNIINASRTTVGGTAPGARNVISGNGRSGVVIYGGENEDGSPGEAKDNFVQGNFIGTDVTGTAAIGNGRDGVQIIIDTSSARTNTIGGPTAESRNIISGNARHGVSIGILVPGLPGTGGTGITVQNNYIGVNVTGQACLGNAGSGIFVDADSTTNTIKDNVIACNGQNGVFIPNNNNPGVRIFIDSNIIFANALLGIDLGDAGITANDLGDPDSGANFLQNFPVLTSFAAIAQVESRASAKKGLGDAAKPGEKKPISAEAITVNGTLNSAPNTTFTVHWYFSGNAQCLTNQAASRPLATGKIPTVSTDASGNAPFSFPFDFPPGINTGIINCTATDPQGNTSEFSACLPVNQPGSAPVVQFSASSYSKPESGPSTNITVTRTGDTSGASSVNFGTGNNGYVACNQTTGTAVQNCDFILSSGTLNFAAGQSSRTFPIIILEDWYQEGAETVSLTLSSPASATLGNQTTATLTITDNDSSAPVGNPLDDPPFYVRQHYYDFLGRLPDDGGLAFWTNEITQCGTNQACINERRVAVSNAFFFELEYQQTASFVFLLYRGAYGNDQPFPNPDFFDGNLSAALRAEAKKLPRYLSFVRDRAQVVGGPNLPQTQLALANAFVTRPEFITKYPLSLTGAQFVDAVLSTIQAADGATLGAADRNALITHFNNGGRGLIMFHLANNYWNDCHRLPGSPTAPCVPAGFGGTVDNRPFIEAEYNRSFVYSQYSGYLRRDGDISGFLFWLTEVNKSPPRNVPRQRAMVCSFMTSAEYQHRLSPVATHNNSECPPPP